MELLLAGSFVSRTTLNILLDFADQSCRGIVANAECSIAYCRASERCLRSKVSGINTAIDRLCRACHFSESNVNEYAYRRRNLDWGRPEHHCHRQAIPSEVLPLKYRALANGFAFLGDAVGGLEVNKYMEKLLWPLLITSSYSVGILGWGGVANASPSGWRDIFWMQAAFHLATFLGLILFYHPTRRSDYPKMSLKGYVWACDPIRSLLFITACTLLLLALDWAGGAYYWSDPHVAAPLGIGFGFLALFCGYGEHSYSISKRLPGRLTYLDTQNGKVVRMALWPTSFSRGHPTSSCRFLHSPSKTGCSTAPSIASHRRPSSISGLRTMPGTSPLGSCPTIL